MIFLIIIICSYNNIGSTGAMVENTDLKPSPKSDQKPAPRIAPFVVKNVGSRDDIDTARILDNGTDDLIAPPDIEPAVTKPPDSEPAVSKPPLTFLTFLTAFGAFGAFPFLYSFHATPVCFII